MHTHGSNRKFSVNEIEIESIQKTTKGDEMLEESEDYSKDYSWKSIEEGYCKRDKSSKKLNVYEYVAFRHHGKQNHIEIPQPLGYDLEEGDLSSLEIVKNRGKIYR